MSAYTSDDLIKSVRVRGMFPDASQGSLSPENILLVASEELRMSIVPMILAVREKYYETFTEYDLTNNQAIYDIPKRAIGSMTSIVQYIVNNSMYALAPLDPKSIITTVSGLYPRGFYFENDKIVVYPTPNATQGTLRVRYYQRPSILLQTINCAQISSVDETNGTVTVSSYPSSWSSAMLVDFVSNKTPYTPYSVDKAISVISAGNVISFTTLPTNREGTSVVQIGDWLAPAGYTPIPEVLDEFFPILAAATALKLLSATGSREDHAIVKEELKEFIASGVKMITPRDVYGLKKVKSDWRNW